MNAAPRSLLIGGFDPSAGAGVLLDAFAASHLGFQPAAAVTLVTAQNSAEWRCAEPIDPTLLAAQLDVLAAEGRFGCVKIGALGSAENVAVVAGFLRIVRPPCVVLDPVIASSSGGTLAAGSVIDAMQTELFGLVDVATPNAAEATLLAGCDSGDPAGAAVRLAGRHGCHVLVTGLPDEPGTTADLLASPGGSLSRHAHPYLAELGDVRGTGCLLSTALACRLSRSATRGAAVAGAHRDLLGMLAFAKAVGRGRMQLDLTARSERC